jgi:hypothetical protein
LVPSPDAQSANTAYLFYKAKPIVVTNPDEQSISIDDSLSEALIAYVLWKAWTKENEQDRAEYNRKLYYECIGEGRRWLKKKSGDARNKIDIDSPISFTGDMPGFSPFR